MEPTPPNPTSTPNVGAPLVEYIRTQRQSAATALIILSVVFLALSGFMAIKAFRAPAPAEKPADKPLTENPFETEQPEPAKPPETANLKRGDYSVGLIGSLAAFLAVASVAGWLLAGPQPVEEGKQRSEARVAILATGAALGTVAILVGLVLFYRWSESLVGWLDRSETREARWVLIPLLIIVVGAGLIFLAIQPARAEERNNSAIRRLVYGSNFGLTVLLLVVGLVVVNVVFAMRVPNRLDATASGFYSVSEPTRELLARLDSPVTAYAILPDAGDNRLIGDVRQLLNASQDAAGGKFTVKFISTMANQKDLISLMAKYPKLELAMSDRRTGRLGAVLLTAGSDEKRHAIIPTGEFFSTQGRQETFVGEAKLFKEVALLADNQIKPVIYFTQSNGELSLSADNEFPLDQRADRLKAYLEKNYLEVRPLNFPIEKPTVPEDAAVVIVAGPRVPFSDAAIAALRKYLTTPHGPEGKKGKLIVLAGAVPGAGNKGMLKTGLEGLLAEFNVRVGDKFVYVFPTQQHPIPDIASAAFNQASGMGRHPITTALVRSVSSFPMAFPREIAPSQTSQSYQSSILLGSLNTTWLEDNRVNRGELETVLRQLVQNESVQIAKSLSERGRPLAVVVTEGGSGLLAVFGCTEFASDEEAKSLPPDTAPFSFDLIGVTIDWLRERPSIAAVGVKAKEYEEYKFPEAATVDVGRLLFLPLGLGLLTVFGLGAGVWMIRRR